MNVLLILDWERRQLTRVAKTNNLTIQHLANDKDILQTPPPLWYASEEERDTDAANAEDPVVSAIDNHNIVFIAVGSLIGMPPESLALCCNDDCQQDYEVLFNKMLHAAVARNVNGCQTLSWKNRTVRMERDPMGELFSCIVTCGNADFSHATQALSDDIFAATIRARSTHGGVDVSVLQTRLRELMALYEEKCTAGEAA